MSVDTKRLRRPPKKVRATGISTSPVARASATHKGSTFRRTITAILRLRIRS